MLRQLGRSGYNDAFGGLGNRTVQVPAREVRHWMYKNIAVAYDESPEVGRALVAANHLAKALGVGLQTITVMEKLPAYTAFATGADASFAVILEQDRAKYYD